YEIETCLEFRRVLFRSSLTAWWSMLRPSAGSSANSIRCSPIFRKLLRGFLSLYIRINSSSFKILSEMFGRLAILPKKYRPAPVRASDRYPNDKRLYRLYRTLSYNFRYYTLCKLTKPLTTSNGVTAPFMRQIIRY